MDGIWLGLGRPIHTLFVIVESRRQPWHFPPRLSILFGTTNRTLGKCDFRRTNGIQTMKNTFYVKKENLEILEELRWDLHSKNIETCVLIANFHSHRRASSSNQENSVQRILKSRSQCILADGNARNARIHSVTVHPWLFQTTPTQTPLTAAPLKPVSLAPLVHNPREKSCLHKFMWLIWAAHTLSFPKELNCIREIRN